MLQIVPPTLKNLTVKNSYRAHQFGLIEQQNLLKQKQKSTLYYEKKIIKNLHPNPNYFLMLLLMYKKM